MKGFIHMTANTFFILLIFVALVGMTLIMETLRRIRNHRMLEYHITHFTRYDTTENPHAVYDAYFRREHETRKVSSNDAIIDDKTWSDLSMDLVFEQLNFTYSAMGENQLYSALRLQHPLVHYEFLDQLEAHPNQHKTIVKRLIDIGKSIYPTYDHSIFENQYSWYHILLTALPFIGVIACFFDLGKGLLWICFSLLINIVISFRFNYYVEKDLKQLFIMGRAVRETEILSKLSITPDFNHALKPLSFISRFRFLLINVETIPGYFVMLFKYMFLIDIHLYTTLVRRFKGHYDTVLACFRYIGELDSLLAIYQYRHHYDTTEPVIADSVQFEGLTHPLIDDAVPNDFNFNQNILLTGSNASGKSTFMKAVALNLILAQAIRTVTADKFQFVPGIVKTTMANADDVTSGDSYFMAELKSLKRLFQQDSEGPLYYFIDEIFKGTNTTERVAASHAVLEYLNQSPQLCVFAATHDIELTDVLASQYANYHFNERVTDGEIVFDYQIKEGPANTRNALELIRIMKFPNRIYTDAQKYVKQLES